MADETNQLRVRLVTPERILFENPVAAVSLPATTGYFEVLYGHAPLMAELGAGEYVHGAPDGEGPRLQRELGLCRSAPRPRHHPCLRRPQARRDRRSPRRAATRPRPRTMEGSRRPAKKPTPRPSASSPKPKPSWPPRRRSTNPQHQSVQIHEGPAPSSRAFARTGSSKRNQTMLLRRPQLPLGMQRIQRPRQVPACSPWAQ